MTIVLASGGYPGSYPAGLPITGVAEAARCDDVTVFHAGTRQQDGALVTAGGRVLDVTARGDDVAAARSAAYEAADRITFEAAHRRNDIAAGV